MEPTTRHSVHAPTNTKMAENNGRPIITKHSDIYGHDTEDEGSPSPNVSSPPVKKKQLKKKEEKQQIQTMPRFQSNGNNSSDVSNGKPNVPGMFSHTQPTNEKEGGGAIRAQLHPKVVARSHLPNAGQAPPPPYFKDQKKLTKKVVKRASGSQKSFHSGAPTAAFGEKQRGNADNVKPEFSERGDNNISELDLGASDAAVMLDDMSRVKNDNSDRSRPKNSFHMDGVPEKIPSGGHWSRRKSSSKLDSSLTSVCSSSTKGSKSSKKKRKSRRGSKKANETSTTADIFSLAKSVSSTGPMKRESFRAEPGGSVEHMGSFSKSLVAENTQPTEGHSTGRLQSILRNMPAQDSNSNINSSDKSSVFSRGTKSPSFISQFSERGSKLKSYLSTYKPNLRRSQRKNEPQKQWYQENFSENGIISRSKVPNYRPGPHIGHSLSDDSSRILSMHSAGRQHSEPSINQPTCAWHDDADERMKQQVPKRAVSFQGRSSNLLPEVMSEASIGESTCLSSGTGILTNHYGVNDGVSSVVSADSFRNPSSPSKFLVPDRQPPAVGTPSGGETTQVFDLPWSDTENGSQKISGRYSGPVNSSLRPHGLGTLVLPGNDYLKFYGKWSNGTLVSPLSSKSEVEHQAPQVIIESAQVPSAPSAKPASFRNNRKIKSVNTDVLASENGGHDAPVNSYYSLGDIARSPRDMVILRSNNEAIKSVSSLKKFEQAFIKRSNGLWTSAILADRALQPMQPPSKSGNKNPCRWYTESEIDNSNMQLEESMLFVINEDGATKIIQKQHWGKFVRKSKSFQGGDDDEIVFS